MLGRRQSSCKSAASNDSDNNPLHINTINTTPRPTMAAPTTYSPSSCAPSPVPSSYNDEGNNYDQSPVTTSFSPVLPSTTTTNANATGATILSQRNPLIRPGWASATTSSSTPTTSCPGSPVSGQSVKETHHISIDYDPISGRKMVNTYEIIKRLGRGQHGKVKLAKSVETGEFVAIKIVDRTGKPRLGKLATSTQEDKVRREIAILKKCVHPNIVRLLEVLDDMSSKKIYLVLEYLEKGEIIWHDESGNPVMTRQRIRGIARDVLSGLEYLHFQGIIHRDIKPANLLLSADDTVKISDFGVSFISSYGTSDEFELAKTAGTPAFFAPELCCTSAESRKPITHMIDIWAFGVTLFCLLYGRVPFIADSEYELFSVISNQKLEFPQLGANKFKSDEDEDVEDLEQAKDLLRKLLEKDPDRRIDISEIKRHPWILKGLSPQEESQFLSSWDESIEVTKEDVRHAVLGMRSRLKNSLSRFGNTALEFAGLRRKSSGTSVATTSTNATTSSSRQSSQAASRDATPLGSRVNSVYASTIHHPHPVHTAKRYSTSPTTPSSLSKSVIYGNLTQGGANSHNGSPAGVVPTPHQMKQSGSNLNLTALLDSLESSPSDEFVEVPSSSATSGEFLPQHYSIIDYDENVESDSDNPTEFVQKPEYRDSDNSDESDEGDGELTLVLGPSSRVAPSSRASNPEGQGSGGTIHRSPSLGLNGRTLTVPGARTRSQSVTVGALNRK